MQLLTFQDYRLAALKLAQRLSLPLSLVNVHHFPDGECSIRLVGPIDSHLVIIRSLNQPNEKLIELLLTCKTARQNGVKRITLIAPYLCYMRQDKAFHRGEGISQQIIGEWLAEFIDEVITVDPHLHRTPQLIQAVPCQQAIALSAVTLFSSLISQQDYALLVGPDSESEQWVGQLAEHAGIPYVVAEKRRSGDRRVAITLPTAPYSQAKVLIVDDMISTGHTLAASAQLIRAAGAASIDALCTHALFDHQAERRLKAAGIQTIYSTDSVVHESNRLSLAPLLASALSRLA